MVKFAAEEYQECKKWIAQKIQEFKKIIIYGTYFTAFANPQGNHLQTHK